MKRPYDNQPFIPEQDLRQPYIYPYNQKEEEFVIFTSNGSFIPIERKEGMQMLHGMKYSKLGRSNLE